MGAVPSCGEQDTEAIGTTMAIEQTDSQSNECSEGGSRSDFAWLADNVFSSESCTSTSCHSPTSSADVLDLSRAAAYQSLTRATASLAPGRVVVPGEPSTSWLLTKLGYNSDIELLGALMPVGRDRLCDDQLEAIARWIEDGALPGTEP